MSRQTATKPTKSSNPTRLLRHHDALIKASGITPKVAKARRYRSVTDKAELQRLGFSGDQCRVPALLLPMWTAHGEIGLYQIRPDTPRTKDGRRLKYETPARARLVLDIPPCARKWMGDPSKPLFITEGIRKADALVSHEVCAVALIGVWAWRGTNELNGKTALSDWESIALNGRIVYLVFDSDAWTNPHVRASLSRLKGFLGRRRAQVSILSLPPGSTGEKVGVDDYLADGHSIQDLLGLRDDSEMHPADNEPLTDLGNARRLVASHGEDLRYVGKWGKWLVWDGRRWKVDETGDVERRMKQVARGLHSDAIGLDDDDKRGKLVRHALSSESRWRLAGAVAVAQTERGISVTPDQLDADPWLLNVENGTLDLRTGELREHSREDLITKLGPVEYAPNAKCPRWERFLERIMNGADELTEFLQRAVGYSLTGSTQEQCFLVLYGTGANGKSTFVTTVLALLGEYARAARSETLLVKHGDSIPNDVARLHGARFVSVAETESGRKLAESLIKQLTGGDRVSARFLYQEEFEFQFMGKIFLATNHRPRIEGTDYAIWRRVRLVPFQVTIPPEDQDKDLGEKLKQELPGILRWAVEGCLAWQREGLGIPKSVEKATAEYRSDMDVFEQFIKDCCRVGTDATVNASDLYAKYQEWCKEEAGISYPLAKHTFGTRLKDHGFKDKRVRGRRAWRGITLLDPPDKDNKWED